jgi:Protein of unknown function (DUF4238)
MNKMANRPRRHHYLPKFYLAGFTRSGDAGGELHVTEMAEGRTWTSSPERAANQREFYAVDLGPSEDPSVMEQILGRLDAEFTRVVREIVEMGRLPSGRDFDCFLNFLALMVVRIPRTRKLVALVTDRVVKEELRGTLSTAEGWKGFRQTLEEQGHRVSDDEYEKYRQLAMSEDYFADLDQTSHVQMMVPMVGPLLATLAERNWSLGIANGDALDLICSDVPLSAWPTKGADLSQPFTISSPKTLITFPITRRLIALGHWERRASVLGVNPQGVAAFNTMTLSAAAQVFSSSPEFTYLAHDKAIRRTGDLVEFLRNREGARDSLARAVAVWYAGGRTSKPTGTV